MSPKAPVVAAVAVGTVMVVGVYAISHRKPKPEIELLSQKVVDVPGKGKFFQIVVRNKAKFEPAEDGTSPYWRLVDQNGHPIEVDREMGSNSEHTFAVPLAYGQPIEHARVELLNNHKTLASIELPPFPLPAERKLAPSDHPLIALSLASYSQAKELIFLDVQPTKALPPGAECDIRIVGTRYATGLSNQGTLEASGGSVPVPFAKDAGWVEADITTYRAVNKFDTITIPGLRLSKVSGQTALAIDRDLDLGIHFQRHLWLKKQLLGVIASAKADDRRPSIELSLGTEDNRLSMETRNHWPVIDQVRIVQPSAKALNVRSLRVGISAVYAFNQGRGYASSDAEIDPNREVDSNPFSLVLRLRCHERTKTGTVRQVIPIDTSKGIAVKPVQVVLGLAGH